MKEYLQSALQKLQILAGFNKIRLTLKDKAHIHIHKKLQLL